MEPTLDEIVRDAVAKTPEILEEQGITLEETPGESQTKETKKVLPINKNSKTSATSEEEEVDEFGLDATAQREGRQLIAGLRDPKKAPLIIKFLAENAGITAPETKTEVVVAKKKLQVLLEESLDPSLKYLADKLSPAIEAYLKDQLEESQRDIRETIGNSQTEKLVEQANIAQDNLGNKYFNGKMPENVITEIGKVMARLPSEPGQKMESYIEDCLFVAAGRLDLKLTSKIDTSKQTKVAKNSMDAASRLASERAGNQVPGTPPVQAPKKMTLDEAVRAANESVKAQLAS